MQFLKVVAILILSSLLCLSVQALKCKDEDNNDVDWFFVYKYPRIEANDIDNVALLPHSGPYVYMTPDNQGKWMISNFSIASGSSIISNTLDPLYTSSEGSIFYVLYNDETPNGTKNEEKGHTKGVILGDETGGIWLVHSVPQFPKLGGTYVYPDSGMRYGQSFLCLSLDLDNLNKVGKQLQYNEPNIYAHSLLDSLNEKLSNLVDASEGHVITNAPYFQTTTLTLDGYDFLSVAKSRHFNKDLYTDLLTSELKSNLLVETWLNGRGRLPSNCSEYLSVKNIESVTIKDTKFHSSKDHSKWAVTDGSTTFWICVGDINREVSQERRGGGTVCLENKSVSRAYRNLIQDVEGCPEHSENIIH